MSKRPASIYKCASNNLPAKTVQIRGLLNKWLDKSFKENDIFIFSVV